MRTRGALQHTQTPALDRLAIETKLFWHLIRSKKKYFCQQCYSFLCCKQENSYRMGLCLPTSNTALVGLAQKPIYYCGSLGIKIITQPLNVVAKKFHILLSKDNYIAKTSFYRQHLNRSTINQFWSLKLLFFSHSFRF